MLVVTAGAPNVGKAGFVVFNCVCSCVPNNGAADVTAAAPNVGNWALAVEATAAVPNDNGAAFDELPNDGSVDDGAPNVNPVAVAAGAVSGLQK